MDCGALLMHASTTLQVRFGQRSTLFSSQAYRSRGVQDSSIPVHYLQNCAPCYADGTTNGGAGPVVDLAVRNHLYSLTTHSIVVWRSPLAFSGHQFMFADDP
jgi:hypothetical protein